MNTPIYDFLINYARTAPARPHMPGHEGKPPVAGTAMDMLYALDITEIAGADSLFEAGGIIAESEANATSLYKTAGTFYSCQGSTLCIQAMLYMCRQEGRRIIAMRNVHRSFLNACALLGLEVTWIYPKRADGILSGIVPVYEIEEALYESREPAAVYITSPDYLGNMADIPSISKVCKKHGALLLCDNAHGAHLAFAPLNRHPIALGADMCCDSAHKMLPALTGAAYLHCKDEKYAKKAKQAMSIFGSTSPSYLILASLDLCNLYLSGNVKDDISRVTYEIQKMQTELAPYYRFSYGDTLHMTIFAAESGTTGRAIAAELEKHRIFVEYADKDVVVLLFSPTSEAKTFRAVTVALLEAAKELGCRSKTVRRDRSIRFCRLRQKMPIREAVLCDYEEIPVYKALGRVCAGTKVPCPPAVPVAVSGEEINAECIELFRHYGIERVCVVRQPEPQTKERAEKKNG